MTYKWPKYLKDTVRNINDTPNSAIGFLRPSDIKSSMDDPTIDAKIGYPKVVSYKDQMTKQALYEANPKKIQVGTYVYVDRPRQPLQKGFSSRRNQIFQVYYVDAGKSPPLYGIKDTMGEKQPGHYYREQLTPSPDPTGNIYKVKDILGRRRRKGKLQLFVSYLHYPKKFNSWIEAENLVEGIDNE